MRLGFILLFLLALTALPAHAADVHRCIGADGGVIFTDKLCADIGASVRPQPTTFPGATSTVSSSHLGTRGCARTPDELKHGLQTALNAGNVNQVAAFYHWPGISGAESDGILKRLQTIADRPLLSVQWIRSHQPADGGGYSSVASEAPIDASAVELVQARSGSDTTQVRTTLTVTHYVGCLWVHF